MKDLRHAMIEHFTQYVIGVGESVKYQNTGYYLIFTLASAIITLTDEFNAAEKLIQKLQWEQPIRKSDRHTWLRRVIPLMDLCVFVLSWLSYEL